MKFLKITIFTKCLILFFIPLIKAQQAIIDVNKLGPKVEKEMFGTNMVFPWQNFD